MTSDKEINNKLDDEFKIYRQLKPKYKRSKRDVWNEMETRIDQTEEEQVRIIPLRRMVLRYAVAAVLVAVLGIGLFMRLYTKSYSTARGMHSEVILPDGSTVYLNAASTLTYHPLWWNINRELKMNGEAFFKVTKGEKFTVISNNVNTTVLGTSFNVFDRDSVIKVSCVTGSVRVSTDNDQVVLKPMQQAVLDDNKQLYSKTIDDVKTINAWIDSGFYYNSASLQKVMNDIELQFDVDISAGRDVDLSALKYSGNYKKNHSVENVLNLVCVPFNLKYQQTGKGQYNLFYDK